MTKRRAKKAQRKLLAGRHCSRSEIEAAFRYSLRYGGLFDPGITKIRMWMEDVAAALVRTMLPLIASMKRLFDQHPELFR